MHFSNEVYRTDDQNSIHPGQQYTNQIEDRLYDVKEITNDQYEGVGNMRTDTRDIGESRILNNENVDLHSSTRDVIVDSGDIVCSSDLTKSQNEAPQPYSLRVDKQEEKLQTVSFDNELQTEDEYPSHSITIYEQNVILENETDLKDLNSSLPSLLQDSSPVDWNAVLPDHSVSLKIEYCPTSNLLLPHLIENQKESFQQLWSSEIDRIKLTDLNTSNSISSILWSLISTGLRTLYCCVKLLRYNKVLFGFCYLIGAFIGMNAYIFLDSLLVITCFISIFVASYEKWLLYFVDFNSANTDNGVNNIDSEDQYSRRMKLAACGFVLGTISTYII